MVRSRAARRRAATRLPRGRTADRRPTAGSDSPTRAPADVVDRGRRAAQRHRGRSSAALQTTPQTFLHGDWKFGNLGRARATGAPCCSTGRTRARALCATSWRGTSPSTGPGIPRGAHQGVDDRRLPAALERHGIATADWWDRSCGSACSAPSCSSDGRRRSATTTSSAGGPTPPVKGYSAL